MAISRNCDQRRKDYEKHQNYTAPARTPNWYEALALPDGRTYNVLGLCVERGREPGVAWLCTLEVELECADREFYQFRLRVCQSAMKRGRFKSGAEGHQEIAGELRRRAARYLRGRYGPRSLSLWDYPIEFRAR